MSTIFNTTHRIVYYQGDERRLSVAEVSPGEEADYSLASTRIFEGMLEGEKEAVEYCRKLAKENVKLTVGLPPMILD